MKQRIKITLLITAVLCGVCEGQVKNLTMSGFVTDKESSKPVEGARVTVIGNKATGDATTDSEGEFIVSLARGVEQGNTVRIQIEKPGYKPYEKLIAASSEIALRVSLDPLRSKPLAIPSQPPIARTDSFSTLVPFHGEWKNAPIPMNMNSGDPRQEYYDSLEELANRPDVHPDGWPDYKPRPFESLDAQYAFVTRLVQFETFRSIYFLERGSVGVKWTAGVGVTPINKPAIKPPDDVDYPFQELVDALTGSEFLRPGDELFWKNKPFPVPSGTHLIFQERAPENGQVFTCIFGLERPGFFKLDFEIQAGPGMNNQLPVGFSTQAIQGTTTFSMTVTMKYAIQRRKDGGFQPDAYAAWAESLFTGLKRGMAFDGDSTNSPSNPNAQ